MEEYGAYVVAAYAISFGAIGALVVWLFADRRAAVRQLARAERALGRNGGRDDD